MLSFPEWEALGRQRVIAGRRLFVADLGPPDDPTPLLFLHGFPTSAHDFTPLLPRLAGRRLVLFDLLGFGLSEKPWPHAYSLFEQADLTAALAAELRLARVHLVAHDMGDTVVQELLARFNEGRSPGFAIASLTLLNGGILVDHVRPIFSQRLLRTRLGGALTAALPRIVSRRLFELSLRRIAGPDRPPPAEELATQFALIERGDGRRLLRHLIGYMREREQHRDRWRNGLLRHPLPMQLVWGDADPINPWAGVEEIQQQRPTTTVVRLHRRGHYPQLEAPDEVARAISDFIARHA